PPTPAPPYTTLFRSPKRGGRITGQTQSGYEATVAVVTKIHQMPWETAAPAPAPKGRAMAASAGAAAGARGPAPSASAPSRGATKSEEHTSELQSPYD